MSALSCLGWALPGMSSHSMQLGSQVHLCGEGAALQPRTLNHLTWLPLLAHQLALNTAVELVSGLRGCWAGN